MSKKKSYERLDLWRPPFEKFQIFLKDTEFIFPDLIFGPCPSCDKHLIFFAAAVSERPSFLSVQYGLSPKWLEGLFCVGWGSQLNKKGVTTSRRSETSVFRYRTVTGGCKNLQLRVCTKVEANQIFTELQS